MEFADLIKVSRIDNVRVRRGVTSDNGQGVTVAVTGHHLILSLEEDDTSPNDKERETWLLHRLLHSVTKDNDSARSGLGIKQYQKQIYT